MALNDPGMRQVNAAKQEGKKEEKPSEKKATVSPVINNHIAADKAAREELRRK